MMKRLAVLLTLVCLCGPAWAGDPFFLPSWQRYSLIDANANPITSANPFPVTGTFTGTTTDPNNASYTASPGTILTSPGSLTPGRGILINCTTAGNVTMTMAGGGTAVWNAGTGSTQLGWSVSAVTAGPTGCTYQTLN